MHIAMPSKFFMTWRRWLNSKGVRLREASLGKAKKDQLCYREFRAHSLGMLHAVSFLNSVIEQSRCLKKIGGGQQFTAPEILKASYDEKLLLDFQASRCKNRSNEIFSRLGAFHWSTAPSQKMYRATLESKTKIWLG